MRKPIPRRDATEAEMDAAAATTSADALAALPRWRSAVEPGGAALLDARADPSVPTDSLGR